VRILAAIFVVAILLLGSVHEAQAVDYDLEWRAGIGKFGLVDGSSNGRTPNKMVQQIFTDALFPVKGGFAAGPYLKLTAIGEIPQLGGGLALGYRLDRFMFLLHGGAAYSLKRPDDGPTSPYGPNYIPPGGEDCWWMGQTKMTYDLGMSFRMFLNQKMYVSVGYDHNSNGHGLGINIFPGRGNNPGIDAILFGAGLRF